MEIKNFLTL